MNERIKELLSQAGVHYEVIPKDTVYEKFAELIIKECIDTVDKTNTHHVLTTFDDGLVRTTMAKTKTAIREHFGVE